MEFLEPIDMAPQSAQEHLESAKSFLERGKDEIREGRRIVDYTKLREGAEKVFHSLVEATTARLTKYGARTPVTHGEVLNLLRERDPPLYDTYREAFNELHVLAYYQGVVDIDKVEASVRRVERQISGISRYVRGR